MGNSPKHGRKGETDPQRQRLRKDSPQCRQISGKPERKPNGERLQVGQQRQRVHDEEGGRWVIPGKKIRSCRLCYSLFEREKRAAGLINRVYFAIEQSVGSGPKPQEIRADRPAHGVGHPVPAQHPCHHPDRTGNQSRRVSEYAASRQPWSVAQKRQKGLAPTPAVRKPLCPMAFWWFWIFSGFPFWPGSTGSGRQDPNASPTDIHRSRSASPANVEI